MPLITRPPPDDQGPGHGAQRHASGAATGGPCSAGVHLNQSGLGEKGSAIQINQIQGFHWHVMTRRRIPGKESGERRVRGWDRPQQAPHSNRHTSWYTMVPLPKLLRSAVETLHALGAITVGGKGQAVLTTAANQFIDQRSTRCARHARLDACHSRQMRCRALQPANWAIPGALPASLRALGCWAGWAAAAAQQAGLPHGQ